MAHYEPSDGLGYLTGALSKKKESKRMTITRRKHSKDPLTGEVVGLGPKEIYVQERRNLDEHPLSENELAQRASWSQVCSEALLIIRDRSHPRYMEMYHRWREQLNSPHPRKQFPNFVRAVLASE